MPTIQLLTSEQINELYKGRMQKDFPKEEIRPLYSIKSMVRQGSYIALGWMHDNTEILSYAFFVRPPNSGMALLDYYAVDSCHRGMGIGGEFISEFKEFFLSAGVGHILLEVEAVQAASSVEDAEMRKRRIHFYEKNGCRSSSLNSTLFGVDYSIMYLSFDNMELTDKELMEEMNKFYKLIVTPLIDVDADYNKYVKLWVE